jgi:hypothetical protein
MTPVVWIPLLTITVSTIVAFRVAAMHRKQMRQIELHRADPSVPLEPPPHPVTRFIRDSATYIVPAVGILLNVIILWIILKRTGPVTRGQVFFIAQALAGIVFLLVLMIIAQTSEVILKYVYSIFDLTHKRFTILGDKVFKSAGSVESPDKPKAPKSPKN